MKIFFKIMCEHDPFNEPELAHPRARELMREEFFWDCVDETAPFGSDEGNDAYYEWRNWRDEHPDAPLTECFNWILCGKLESYNTHLASNSQVETDISNPNNALLGDQFDIFTLDTTMLATGLGQMVDEGKIDSSAKPYLQVAIQRQRHPQIQHYSSATLDSIERVVNEA